MATPNEYKLKGKLQIVIEGTDNVVDLGDIELPIRVDVGAKPSKPGPVFRVDAGRYADGGILEGPVVAAQARRRGNSMR